MVPLHIAQIESKDYLYLKKVKPTHFEWFRNEEATGCFAPTLEEALAEGRKRWGEAGFRLVKCGFRYRLPERDEVGSNALFHQMVQSYQVPNGRYFDSEVGHMCYVDFASQEALALMRGL